MAEVKKDSFNKLRPPDRSDLQLYERKLDEYQEIITKLKEKYSEYRQNDSTIRKKINEKLLGNLQKPEPSFKVTTKHSMKNGNQGRNTSLSPTMEASYKKQKNETANNSMVQNESHDRPNSSIYMQKIIGQKNSLIRNYQKTVKENKKFIRHYQRNEVNLNNELKRKDKIINELKQRENMLQKTLQQRNQIIQSFSKEEEKSQEKLSAFKEILESHQQKEKAYQAALQEKNQLEEYYLKLKKLTADFTLKEDQQRKQQKKKEVQYLGLVSVNEEIKKKTNGLIEQMYTMHDTELASLQKKQEYVNKIVQDNKVQLHFFKEVRKITTAKLLRLHNHLTLLKKKEKEYGANSNWSPKHPLRKWLNMFWPWSNDDKEVFSNEIDQLKETIELIQNDLSEFKAMQDALNEAIKSLQHKDQQYTEFLGEVKGSLNTMNENYTFYKQQEQELKRLQTSHNELVRTINEDGANEKEWVEMIQQLKDAVSSLEMKDKENKVMIDELKQTKSLSQEKSPDTQKADNEPGPDILTAPHSPIDKPITEQKKENVYLEKIEKLNQIVRDFKSKNTRAGQLDQKTKSEIMKIVNINTDSTKPSPGEKVNPRPPVDYNKVKQYYSYLNNVNTIPLNPFKNHKPK
ncbi:hypothetical protein [Pseudalkalibacillus caeni]|uniref:Uncharacterized protein n=1 Tax=Exobacillus caeni TaxID=2574798 RepID=A0A5R9F9C4_9BACL|nr:hypothetical protein [Pseudalkalibacillus caeni]TLS37463.1 hypothetical protein FCL54_09970 [Pseudalkalibacillus caeni]